MDGSLYDDDYYAWVQAQAQALRALSARQVDNEVDWANLVEEVEDLGENVVRAVRSALFRLMEHAALLALAPDDHRGRPHWLGDMRVFRRDAVADFAPSMRRLVTPAPDGEWRTARQVAADKLGLDVALLPDKRPFTLPELLHALPIDELPARLRRGGAGPGAATPRQQRPGAATPRQQRKDAP